jgi:hypothetical protein
MLLLPTKILKFSQFLFESRAVELPVPEISKESIIELISKFTAYPYNINTIKTRIYRGVDQTAPVLSIKPSEHKRLDSFSPNYSNILQGGLPSWKAYPKRSNSLTCTTSLETAEERGEPYLIIPASPQLAICPAATFADSFEFFSKIIPSVDNIDQFNYYLQNIFTELKVKISNYEEMKTAFSKLESLPLKNYYLSSAQEQKLEYYLKNYSNDHILDSLNNLMSPDKNDFKLIDYNNATELSPNIEVWTSSNCLMIKNEIIEKYFLSND